MRNLEETFLRQTSNGFSIRNRESLIKIQIKPYFEEAGSDGTEMLYDLVALLNSDPSVLTVKTQGRSNRASNADAYK